MATVLDFAAAFPSGASIKAAGHSGVVAYISPPRESWMGAKPLTRAVVDDYRAHELDIGVVWQYGGVLNPDAMRGARGGELDARSADEALRAAGLEGWPVYFAVDFDVSIEQWNSVVVDYFRAACRVLGRDRVGIYGHSRAVHWAMEDGVVAEVAPGRALGWITRSWGSVGKGGDYSTLYQGTHNVPGPEGVLVDVNTIRHDYWGQRPPEVRQKPDPSRVTMRPNPHHRGDPHFLPDVLRAFGVPVEFLDGWDTWGMGDFDRIWGVCVHHTGSNNTSARYIARNDGLQGALSSQLHQKRTPPYAMTLCGVGIAWHMGKGSYPGLPTNAANDRMIGIEPQSNGTDPWPAGMLDVYHRAVAAILWYLGHNSSRCISHWEYSLIAQGKWDPGAGDGVVGHLMDMDHFRSRVQHYIDHPPFMEGINDMALDLNKRYKFRTPAGYFEGDEPGDGTLIDVWLNSDTHAWVSRVNTEAILKRLDKLETQLAGERELTLELISVLGNLAGALRESNDNKEGK